MTIPTKYIYPQTIAVEMAGLPRFSQETTDFINYIKNQYPDSRVDWFFYLWGHSDEVSVFFQRRTVHPFWANVKDFIVARDLISKHLPQNHCIGDLVFADPRSIFNPYNEYGLGDVAVRNFNMHRMLYSFQMCSRLRTSYENKINIAYDLVIRGRPDIAIQGHLPQVSLPSNQVLMSRSNLHGGIRRTNDTYLMGPGAAMSKVADMFNHISELTPYCMHEGRPHPETMLGIYCHAVGIDLSCGEFDVALRPLYNEQTHRQNWGDWAP